MIQTLATGEAETKALSEAFGLNLAGRVHHCPRQQFYSILDLLAAKYRYGLSAPPNRRDGLEKMIYLSVRPRNRDDFETGSRKSTRYSSGDGFC